MRQTDKTKQQQLETQNKLENIWNDLEKELDQFDEEVERSKRESGDLPDFPAWGSYFNWDID